MRREHRAMTKAGAAVDHPWRRPVDVDDAREAYLAAYDRAGAPPLRVREGETVAGERGRLKGAPAQSLWNAARFDPDPDVRLSALSEALAYCRDELVICLDRALYGAAYARERPALSSAGRGPVTPWAPHGSSVGRFEGPLEVCGWLLMVAPRCDAFPEGVEPLQRALEELIADAESVGVFVEPVLGGLVEANERTSR